jgi:hypothetical protein
VIEEDAVAEGHLLLHEVARLEVAHADPGTVALGAAAASSIEHSLGSLFINQ